MLNLDTHIVLHSLRGTLTAAERRLLEDHTWSISAIVLWEIAKLAQLGRINIDLHDPTLTELLRRMTTWPISVEICSQIARLDFRGDPVDELVGATSLVHGVPLVTRDRRIRRSKIVPIARERMSRRP